MNHTARQFQRLKQVFRGEMLPDEPMSRHTTFHIGGPVDFYLYPRDLEDLASAMDFAQREGLPWMVIGNGSNLLVADAGLRGLVLDLSKGFGHLAFKENKVVAGAGVPLGRLVKYCHERGLSGLEWACGVPARVGGALRLNAGAYGACMADLLIACRVVNADGTLELRDAASLDMGYRQIDLPADSVIIEAELRFTDGDPQEMGRIMGAYQSSRRAKQPLSLPSAGSTFRNPPDGAAGRLIEEAGCKGLRIGDAMVSKKHANFIINCGNASATDVRRLMAEVSEKVERRFGVVLQPEIHQVGFTQS